ncbi:tRNA uracil 4-sulfurtransferase ThiI [Vulcanisaeta thermophila]|uniref:tRNA uracil 4-sulfurtransferase ThiI n=1 Tax=Vulcanisaeta thermophila TaxID=867917 RepID=UPI0008536D79|nr:tRNA uracil 4-sulfurtransferase ThiI [Vulcanisaeta thermophila]
MVVLLIGYGEVAIKGPGTRRRMENLLMRNIMEGLKKAGIEARVSRSQGRLLVEVSDDRAKDAVDLVSRVFGVKFVAPAREYVVHSINDIVNAAVREWASLVKDKVFAVRSHRVGVHGFTSMDINREVGAALRQYARGVDLERPDVELHIEVRGDRAYLFHEVVKGPGGLPLGSEGKVLALISGGLDSPVAAWFMMKRGAYVDAMFCSLAHPLDTLGFLRVAHELFSRWSIGYDASIHIINCSGLVNEIRGTVNPHLWNVVYKHILYRIAQAIAKSTNALGIVTGESLGQVSSQTLHNLMAASHGIDIPIYRPLIGLDKDEIVSYARMIGTYELSIKNEEFCAIFSEKPRTRATPEDVEAEVSKLSPGLIDEALSTMVTIKASSIPEVLKALEDSQDVDIDVVPRDAVVIDLRSKPEYESWHYPGAINANIDNVMDLVKSMGKDRVYVLYCSRGLSSRFVASELRRMGYRAFSISIEKLRDSYGKGQ